MISRFPIVKLVQKVVNTFNPGQGVEDLKSVNESTGGFECESDYWYWDKFRCENIPVGKSC
jgi:hypothetical protein